MTGWLLDQLVAAIPGADYRTFNRALLDAIVLLWIGVIFTGLVGNTIFIGHVSMFALVLAVYSALRSDEPAEGEDAG